MLASLPSMCRALALLLALLGSCHGAAAGLAPMGPLAPLGPPSAALFNGLKTIADTAHRVAPDAVAAQYLYFPEASASVPEIPSIQVLGRRDALIVYVPAIQGAADYRVRVAGGSVTYSDYRIRRPERQVWACAGFRQRAWLAKEDAQGVAQRELMQTIELPGLTQRDEYWVEVQALAEPCPFTGMPAHTSALIPMGQAVLQGLAGSTIPYVGFDDVIARYGGEILNGQWGSADFFDPAGQRRGQARPPSAPQIIARSMIRVNMPFADEATDAPVIDVGPNSIFDDFRTDGVATAFTRIPTRSFSGSDAIEGPFNNWYFWGGSAQAPQGKTDTDPPLGVQVWQRHGRLNITMADWAQDVFAATHFASLKSGVQTLDDTRYVHSFFRVNSDATGRRYWHWMMCGGAEAGVLIDPATNVPRIRHLLRPAFYDDGGINPTAPAFGEALTPAHQRECIQLLQLAASNPNLPQLPDGSNGPAPNQTLVAVVNPEGSERGVINLTPAVFDRGYGTKAITWRLNAAGQYAGPVVEPFDQVHPLTHFDVFVRRNRMVLFINGRQAACWDMSQRPLTMSVGQIVYGQVLYHTDAEVNEYYYPKRVPTDLYRMPMGNFNLTLNTPAADHRAWDAVGHAEKLDIPALFKFDAALCRLPGSVAVK
jgi:hypothetical protein